MTTLVIVDFDWTLFRSPPRPGGAEGPDDEWWRGAESLLPPAVPAVPGPEYWIEDTVEAVWQLLDDETADVHVVTGRLDAVHRERVKGLVTHEYGEYLPVHCKPTGGKTVEFKAELIRRLLRECGHDHVIVYEDRLHHLPAFKAAAEAEGATFEAVPVRDPKHPLATNGEND